VSIRLAERGVRAVLLDIEGTTTPIAFVHEVLFPFARARLDAWIHAAGGSAELAAITTQLASEHAEDLARGESPPLWRTAESADLQAWVASYAAWLMDRDRKSPGLKALQGLIWEEGYQAGRLRGEVFPDVAAALRRWRAAGIATAIYSSGSELAQRRLFESTPEGDLTPLLSGFFDTAVGPKRDPTSYRRIADRLQLDPTHILFISDVDAELAAAETAGHQVVLSLRPGNPPQVRGGRFLSIHSLDEID
jgi:enolase-phosphatase E1